MKIGWELTELPPSDWCLSYLGTWCISVVCVPLPLSPPLLLLLLLHIYVCVVWCVVSNAQFPALPTHNKSSASATAVRHVEAPPPSVRTSKMQKEEVSNLYLLMSETLQYDDFSGSVAGPTICNSLPDNVISVNLPSASENISVPRLVPWHYHWSPVNYAPPPVDPVVILLLGPL